MAQTMAMQIELRQNVQALLAAFRCKGLQFRSSVGFLGACPRGGGADRPIQPLRLRVCEQNGMGIAILDKQDAPQQVSPVLKEDVENETQPLYGDVRVFFHTPAQHSACQPKEEVQRNG